MRFRLAGFDAIFCLTFTTLPSSASAALKGRDKVMLVLAMLLILAKLMLHNVLPAGSSGSINADGQFKSLCLQPTEVSVKLPGNKRRI